MNTFRAKPMNHVTFIMLIIVLFPTIPAPLKATGEQAIDVPLYKSPTINGVVSAGEYPPAQLVSTWGSLYASHDADRIVFGIVLNHTCRKIDLLFNKGNLDATVLAVSTVRYSVDKSGVLEYYYGRGDEWVESSVSDISLEVVNGTTSWVIEIAIPLSKLDVSPNTERTIGFALIVSETALNYSWPGAASPKNPSTWGVIRSPDNWATRNDICLETILDRRNVIAGSNVTLVLILTNKGDAAISDYRISIMLDNVLIEESTGSQLGLKTPLEQTDRIRYEKKIVNVANGTHILKVNVTGLDIRKNPFYDADEKNNARTESFTARYAEIEVSGIPGVSVSLDGESQVIPEEGKAVFYSTAGIKRIRTENVYNPLEGVRYVFVRWRSDGSVSEDPELTVNVNEDLAFTIEYRKEYFVNLSFIDKDNSPLTPPFYTCVFPNGTFYNGTLRSFWLTSGDLRITGVSYAGLNVLEEAEKTYDIHEPKEISISCNVRSGTIQVVDPFSAPVSGAEVSAVFLNNTGKTYVTDSNGMVNMSRVAGGRVKLTVSHMGYSTSVDVDFSKEENVTIRIPVSLNIVLIIVVVVSIVAIIIVLKMFSHKIFRRESERTPAEEEEYEFEEI